MKFVFADSLDFVDPKYDFQTDSNADGREPYWDDLFPHEQYTRFFSKSQIYHSKFFLLQDNKVEQPFAKSLLHHLRNATFIIEIPNQSSFPFQHLEFNKHVDKFLFASHWDINLGQFVCTLLERCAAHDC